MHIVKRTHKWVHLLVPFSSPNSAWISEVNYLGPQLCALGHV